MKKILGVFLTTILITSFTAPVYADKLEIDCVADPTNEVCIMPLDDENPTPETTAIPQPTDYPEENKPLIITPADENTEEPADKTTVEATDPDTASEIEMWPVYLSFGAIGAAVLVFVVLNLFGNKK